MMKKILLVLFFASLLILSGCEKEDSSNTLITSFYGGNEGVSIEFKEIAPPDQINQGEEIFVFGSFGFTFWAGDLCSND